MTAGTRLARIDSRSGILPAAPVGSFALLGVVPLAAGKAPAPLRRTPVAATAR